MPLVFQTTPHETTKRESMIMKVKGADHIFLADARAEKFFALSVRRRYRREAGPGNALIEVNNGAGH